MKVIKTYAGDSFNRPCWTAYSADGRCLADGYPHSTPAEARRVGEQAIALESVARLNGDSAAIRFILGIKTELQK